jgi:uncharacterized protein DUF4436
MSTPQTQPVGGRNIVGIVIAIVAFLILVIAYVTVLRGYSREGESRSFKVEDTQNADEDFIDVDVKVISVDPVKGDLTARITFEPQGELAKDEVSPAEDITLFINSATGKQEHKFEKGKRMNPIDATVSLEGQSSDYPFDSHDAELWLVMTTPVKEKPSESSAAAGEEAPAPRPQTQASVYDTNEPVPMAVAFAGSIPGFKLEAEKDKANDVGYTRVEMKISRSSTVVFFSVFVMVLMLFLASAVVLMMLRFWLGKRKIEVSAMSVYGAMLFAFPALRASQPGVPPLGTYSDYVSFFWAEMLVAVSLVTIISLWVLRRPS